jgi:hypothetical protein
MEPNLIASLEDQVKFLREELARKDAIMLNMTEAMKSLEAAPESHESWSSTSPYPGQRRGSGGHTALLVAQAVRGVETSRREVTWSS